VNVIKKTKQIPYVAAVLITALVAKVVHVKRAANNVAAAIKSLIAGVLHSLQHLFLFQATKQNRNHLLVQRFVMSSLN
jgi:hypothetical protein